MKEQVCKVIDTTTVRILYVHCTHSTRDVWASQRQTLKHMN